MAGTTTADQPTLGLDPAGFFGDPNQRGNVFSAPYEAGQQKGAGAYFLPRAFSGWTGPARYAFAPVSDYAQKAQSGIDYFKGEMGKDYEKELYGASVDAFEGQAKNARRQGQQGLARAGYGGGGAVSPFAALQVQQESEARSGALGTAARDSIFRAQAMHAESARNYLNSISQYLQALLVPAQIQQAAGAKAPIGQLGPQSLVGPAMNVGASLIGAAA